MAERAGHSGAITALSTGTLDGRPIAVTCGQDRVVCVWDLDPVEEIGRVEADAPAGTAVLVTTQRKETVAVVGREGGSVTSYVLPSGRPIAEPLTVEPWPVAALAAVRGVLIVAYKGGSVHRFDIDRLKPVGPPMPGPVGTLAAGAIGEEVLLAIGRPDGTVAVGRLGEPEPRFGKPAGEGGAPAVAIVEADDGPVVLYGGADGAVHVWDVARDAQQEVHTKGAAPVVALAAAGVDGLPVVLAARADGALQQLDPAAGGPMAEVATGDTTIGPLGVASVGGRPVAVTGGTSGVPHVWDLAAGGHVEDGNDKVEWLSDAPATEDLLRRKPLARALARRLERIRAADPGTSFLIHVDGEWGTGKSTIMRFLRGELGREWLVVDFNAWRQSRVVPPWWALLTALRQAINDDLPRRGRMRLWAAETWIRLRRTGASHLLAAMALLVVAVVLLLVVGPGGIGDAARTISAVAAALGTLWVALLVGVRLFLWESAKGARVYEQSQADPMQSVAAHFAWLAARTRRPIMFFIDDLDRCPGSYVVDLLEAVQTLVRDAGGREATYFLVAADGSWVRASYELRYQDFAGSVAEPGRPLGYLFLDKLFQLTVRVPAVSAQEQGGYLADLLKLDRSAPGVEEEIEQLRSDISHSSNDAQVVETLRGASAPARQAVASEAVERLSDQAVEHATEHALEKFAALLEPNPRAMKRFVNAFGMARVVLTLEDVLVPFDALALWTILSTRWPMLADRLREHPDAVGAQASADGGAPEDWRGLLAAHEVQAVIGFPEGGPLTPQLIRECVAGRAPSAPA